VLFAFDLDKTLVTNDYRLPERTPDVMRALRDAGHVVTVLTGRPLGSARPFLDALGVAGPFSVNHGAQVMGEGGRTLRRTRLLAADVRALLGPWATHPTVEFSCVVDDQLFVKDPADQRWHWAHTESRVVSRFDPTVDTDADKVVFAAETTTVEIVEHVAAKAPLSERYLWSDGFLEVVAAGGAKGHGRAFIAAQLGFERHEVVAFGDGLNDVSMVRWAGHGVAVGPDAHPDTIAASDERVASPEEGGVLDWLERHYLTGVAAD
jgi:Cof subfamily protein (haloacid dehalogenase superfamily)